MWCPLFPACIRVVGNLKKSSTYHNSGNCWNPVLFSSLAIFFMKTYQSSNFEKCKPYDAFYFVTLINFALLALLPDLLC